MRKQLAAFAATFAAFAAIAATPRGLSGCPRPRACCSTPPECTSACADRCAALGSGSFDGHLPLPCAQPTASSAGLRDGVGGAPCKFVGEGTAAGKTSLEGRLLPRSSASLCARGMPLSPPFAPAAGAPAAVSCRGLWAPRCVNEVARIEPRWWRPALVPASGSPRPPLLGGRSSGAKCGVSSMAGPRWTCFAKWSWKPPLLPGRSWKPPLLPGRS
mmetsp:Transcript_55352/g.160370  ORF Transcript_55352/g.160370 Transcript_55352/m.160370 type:complete len:216 (-) Transcript_55352:937-1584(-)